MTPGQRGKKNTESSFLLFSAPSRIRSRGMKFVYILVGFTRECLNRQTAAGLPLSAINQQQRLSPRCALFLLCVLCTNAVHVCGGSRRKARWLLCAKEHMIYCWESLKVQSSKFNKEAVFKCAIFSYLLPRGGISPVSIQIHLFGPFNKTRRTCRKQEMLEAYFFWCLPLGAYLFNLIINVFFHSWTQNALATCFINSQPQWTLIFHDQIKELTL